MRQGAGHGDPPPLICRIKPGSLPDWDLPAKIINTLAGHMPVSTQQYREPRVGMMLETGEMFPVDGYYSYAGHKDADGEKCFVSPRAIGGMLFLKGMRVPNLGSCPHAIYWRLNSIY